MLIVVMATTGPRAGTETTGLITRTGGVCLQLEQWGLFGWVIVGQTYSEADASEGTWNTPPRASPPCEDVPEAEYAIMLPREASPDVYRLCGLADEAGCLTFSLVEAGV